MARRQCDFPLCGKPHKGQGLCDGHIQQKRAGKTLSRLSSTTSDADRFWSHVDLFADGGHWLWTSHKVKGYGHFTIGRNVVKAHRWVYEEMVAPIPDGLEIDHICRVRDCVNPDHLRLATRNQNQENIVAPTNSTTGVRGVTWGRRQRKWKVHAMHLGKTYHGGYFSSLADAERAAIALRNSLFTHNDTDRQEGAA
jgi:hypothetical protein